MEMTFGLRWKLRIAPELNHLLHAIDAVNCQHGEDAEVNNQHGPVERVEVIERTDVQVRFVNRIAKAGRIDAEVPRDRCRAKPAFLQTQCGINSCGDKG